MPNNHEAKSRLALPNPEKEEKESLWLHFFKSHGMIGALFIIALTFFVKEVATHISKQAIKAAEAKAKKLMEQSSIPKKCPGLKINFLVKHPRTIGNRPPSPYGVVKILDSKGVIYQKEYIGHRKGKSSFTARFFEKGGLSIKSGSKIKIWLGHKYCKRLLRKTYCLRKRAYGHAEAPLHLKTKTSAKNYYYNASIECQHQGIQQ